MAAIFQIILANISPVYKSANKPLSGKKWLSVVVIYTMSSLEKKFQKYNTEYVMKRESRLQGNFEKNIWKVPTSSLAPAAISTNESFDLKYHQLH